MTRVPQAPSGAVEAQVGHVIHLVWQRVVPAGRRAEQYICLHWQVYLLIGLKGVLVLTALLQALFKVVEGVKGVPPLSPPSPPTPCTPGSPYRRAPWDSPLSGNSGPEYRGLLVQVLHRGDGLHLGPPKGGCHADWGGARGQGGLGAGRPGAAICGRGGYGLPWRARIQGA